MFKLNTLIYSSILLGGMVVGLAFPLPELRAGSLSATTVVAGVETCFDDWAEAGDLARSNNLASAKDVAKLTRQRQDGRIVKMMLCTVDGRFVYRLFLENAGRVSSQVVDAAKPFAE